MIEDVRDAVGVIDGVIDIVGVIEGVAVVLGELLTVGLVLEVKLTETDRVMLIEGEGETEVDTLLDEVGELVILQVEEGETLWEGEFEGLLVGLGEGEGVEVVLLVVLTDCEGECEIEGVGVVETEGLVDEVVVVLVSGMNREGLMLEDKDPFVELADKGLALGDNDV